MADEEKQQQPQDADATPDEAARAEDAAVESDAAAEDAAAESTQAPAEEAAPEEAEPVAAEATAEAPEEPPAEEPAAQAAADEAPAAAPAETLHPKERKRRARSTHTGEARPQQSPGERQAERQRIRAEKAARRRAGRAARREKARQARGAETVPTAPRTPRESARQKVRQGVVVSDKADKTITVRIDVSRRHRRYEKIVRTTATLHAHDEQNEAHEGDLVRIVETRPLSRTKRWRLADVLERAR